MVVLTKINLQLTIELFAMAMVQVLRREAS